MKTMMFKPGKKLFTLIFKNFDGMKIILTLLTTFLFAIKKKSENRIFKLQ